MDDDAFDDGMCEALTSDHSAALGLFGKEGGQGTCRSTRIGAATKVNPELRTDTFCIALDVQSNPFQ